MGQARPMYEKILATVLTINQPQSFFEISLLHTGFHWILSVLSKSAVELLVIIALYNL